jgi:hypothetical protein
MENEASRDAHIVLHLLIRDDFGDGKTDDGEVLRRHCRRKKQNETPLEIIKRWIGCGSEQMIRVCTQLHPRYRKEVMAK